MKIPKIGLANNISFKVWEDAARQMSLETGIYIAVDFDYFPGEMYVKRVYFEVDGHQFESLNDLKKAITNKLFL